MWMWRLTREPSERKRKNVTESVVRQSQVDKIQVEIHRHTEKRRHAGELGGLTSERTGVSVLVSRRHLTNSPRSDRGVIVCAGLRGENIWVSCVSPGPGEHTPPWITHSSQLNSRESRRCDRQGTSQRSQRCLRAHNFFQHMVPLHLNQTLSRGTEVHRWNSNPSADRHSSLLRGRAVRPERCNFSRRGGMQGPCKVGWRT